MPATPEHATRDAAPCPGCCKQPGHMHFLGAGLSHQPMQHSACSCRLCRQHERMNAGCSFTWKGPARCTGPHTWPPVTRSKMASMSDVDESGPLMRRWLSLLLPEA